MKITKSQLRQIIREEIQSLNERELDISDIHDELIDIFTDMDIIYHTEYVSSRGYEEGYLLDKDDKKLLKNVMKKVNRFLDKTYSDYRWVNKGKAVLLMVKMEDE